GRTYREELSILADARVALVMLREAAQSARLDSGRWAGWTADVRARGAAWFEGLGRGSRGRLVEGRLDPYHVLPLLNRYLRSDALVVADTGYMAAWATTVLSQSAAGRNTLRAAGSLGWAFPASFGAKLAVGSQRRVFCLTGDGGIGYHLADLETALRLNT